MSRSGLHQHYHGLPPPPPPLTNHDHK
jgi:hypothetical protein